uniref:F-box domain-containing protein n=1 Tax=Setaria italica TaxID=4555 RepID=K3Y2L2_SETIT
MAVVSDLPPELLDLIRARLPLREAARASVLSAAWGRSWRDLSDIDFTSSTCDRAAIDAVLAGHSGGSAVRRARLNALSEKMLQSFDLNFNAVSSPPPSILPNSMFACGALKDLFLTCCVLPAASFTKLCLICSSFAKGSDVEAMIAMPQKLEELTMRVIEVAEAWGTHGVFSAACMESSVENLLYNYYSLQIPLPKEIPASYEDLRRLILRMDYNKAPDISTTIYFLRSARKLTQLVVQ